MKLGFLYAGKIRIFYYPIIAVDNAPTFIADSGSVRIYETIKISFPVINLFHTGCNKDYPDTGIVLFYLQNGIISISLISTF